MFILASSLAAHADSYTSVVVGGEWSTVAVNDYGEALLAAPVDKLPCVGAISNLSFSCYVLFNYNTGVSSVSATTPYFVQEANPKPGPGCPTSAPVGFDAVICNNGHWLYLGDHGLFDGPDPSTDLVFVGEALDIKTSPSRNLLFEEAQGDRSIELIDLTTLASTPEPSSFALLGTGLLGIAGVVKRRYA